MSKVKVAVLGYGHLGKWHCQKVDNCENAELVAIVEKFEASQKIAKEKHPHAEVIDNVESVLDKIDAAVIVTPTSTHFELVKFFLQKGKHVFCEKPLCNHYEEALELEKLVNETGLTLQVGHSERFHSIWGKVKELIEPNDKLFININRVASFKGRATDVDVVPDLTIHDLDLIYYLTGKEAKSLKAVGKKLRTDKYDFARVEVNFSDGSEAVITSSRNHVREVRDIEIYTSNGCIYVDMMTNEFYYADKVAPEGNYVVTESYQKRDHLQLEHDHFYSSILNKEKPIVDIEDGKKAVLLIEKSVEALNTGSTIQL
jgi:predicted dehydrogenase